MKLMQEINVRKDGETYSMRIFATDDGCLGHIFRPDGSRIEKLSVHIVHPNGIEFPPSNMDICENIIQILAVLLFTVTG